MKTWKAVLAGENIGSSEFFGFVPLDANDEFLEEAFSTIQNGNVLINKLKELLRKNKSTGEYIIPANKKITEGELYRCCQNLSENILLNTKENKDEDAFKNIRKGLWKTTDDSDFFLSYISDSPTQEGGVSDMVYYEFNDFQEKILGHAGYCLQEALYRLTANYNMVYFLMQELVGFPIDFNPYYKIWQSGSNIWYMEDGWFVLKGNIE